jgi:hypothetical protein
MADDVVAERGVLTAPAEAWVLAVRRADVIRELAAQRVVGLDAADTAAARLGVSRRQVYVLVGRWRAGEGVASDLLRGPAGHPGPGVRALRRGVRRLGPAARRVHRPHRQIFG